MKKLLISLAILTFAALMTLAVTQTGNLIVTVMSEEGQVLPGASVTLTSSVLMGARTQVTGASGKATFRNLPPGEYAIDVTMDGFQPYRQAGIDIRLTRTAKADVSMKLGQAKEIIEVVGTGPLVDTTSTTVGTEFDFDNYINHMPTGRHYVNVAGLAPGVISQNNPSSAGGGYYNNAYLIDGSYSMDSRTHTWGNQFNVDTVSDMNLIQAGATAEYGRAMGAIFNIVTKSGSNEITALARLEMNRLLWNDISENNPNITTDNTRTGAQGNVWNYSGGGPLYPDMIWWYVGYSDYARETGYNRRLNPMSYGTLTSAIRTYWGHLFSVKGTLQLGEDIKATVLYREDPIDIYNVNSQSYYGSQCLPSADQVQHQGGTGNLMFSASYIIGESAFVEAAYSMDGGEISVNAQGEDTSGEGYWEPSSSGTVYYSNDGWWWGGIIDDYYSERDTNTARFAFNYLVDSDSIGSHDIKAGVEYQDMINNVRDTYYPGNEYITTGDLTDVGFDAVPYYTRTVIEDRLPWAEIHGKYLTVYLQDSWQLMDNLTVNLGVRTDKGLLENNQEDEVLSDGIFTALAPRLGFVYDLSGSALRASVGRYYDTYNMYIADNFNYYTTPETWIKYAAADGVDGRNGWVEVDRWQEGTLVSPHSLDPDIIPPYVDEATVGFDWLLNDSLAVSLTGIYRYYTGVCRTDTDGDRGYYWTNIETEAHGSAQKIYWGGILEINKRPTDDNLFLSASFTYQDLQGFGAYNGDNFQEIYFANPYQTEERVDYYWGDISGYHWFAKGQATYFFPNNWYVGVQANLQQGSALSSYRYVSVPGYGTVQFFPNGRGDMDRLPTQFWMDVQFGIEQNIELPFDLPLWDDTIILGIYANIYNVFDNMTETSYQSYMASSIYGQANGWRGARNYQLGFRIEL